MSRIIMILLVLGAIVFWWHWTNTPDAAERKRLLQRSVIGVLIAAILLLVVTGHMHWLGAVLAGVLAFVRQSLPLLVRYAPLVTRIYHSRVSSVGSSPNSSSVSSKFLYMTLDHNTGKLSGKVLDGEFKGRVLDEMSRDELARLLDWCSRNDVDSARLLDSYLAARFGQGSGQGHSAYEGTRNSSGSAMSVEEALQVLGLKGTPTKEDITSAYRRIMQQLHPDRGGNEYFAAKVNQARDVLNSRFG